MKKIELLSPAGSLEKLKIAIIYGADAVYIGGEQFGLRVNTDNFTIEEMKEGVEFAHARGKKVYLTMNILAHNYHFELEIEEYIRVVAAIGIDAIIVSDPGILALIKKVAPDMEIHLSTQASTTNSYAANFWYEQGVKRVVLARELTLEEIAEVNKSIPEDMEIECFVHGAMCISYSGRCLLSSYMINRNANLGACAHPCRWKYSLVEEQRPDIAFPVEEDDNGTYIMNSRDLCMIRYIPEMVKAGIYSFKIEGRAKSAYYTATVTAAYRRAIDQYYSDPDNYKFDEDCFVELCKASHREFYTGFYFGQPGKDGQVYTNNSYERDCVFSGLVLEYDKESGLCKIEQRNRLFVGETIELLMPSGEWFSYTIENMLNDKFELIDVAPHAQQIFYLDFGREIPVWSILRRPGEQ